MIFRTDIAKESCENTTDQKGIKKRDISSFGISGTVIEILDDSTAKECGKQKGKYITFESNAVLNRNVDEYENISMAMANELKSLLNIKKDDTVLVAGLGNESMTPDSIGPKTVKKTLVTRHIFEFLPEEKDERMHSVCAVAPGVLGVTGIESSDIIKSICSAANVKAVIAVDALAARRQERMFSTFQMSDTGIEPGAGIGNKRNALTSASLGIPVIAIGVPTVVYASSLVYDAALKASGSDAEAKKIANTQDMIVTPKEIDIVAADAAKIIADCVNLALHEGMTIEEINSYTGS